MEAKKETSLRKGSNPLKADGKDVKYVDDSDDSKVLDSERKFAQEKGARLSWGASEKRIDDYCNEKPKGAKAVGPSEDDEVEQEFQALLKRPSREETIDSIDQEKNELILSGFSM